MVTSAAGSKLVKKLHTITQSLTRPDHVTGTSVGTYPIIVDGPDLELDFLVNAAAAFLAQEKRATVPIICRDMVSVKYT